ncbi:MAG: sigma-70 family RNA polymerase sigma factor [Bacteroidales bacterium]|jgi:RNA polymerase sigma-70 factor (ECF subfamily)|nr:sigma-70 family RNA polymerase sigma factor [Bacteroidales bacterium]
MSVFIAEKELVKGCIAGKTRHQSLLYLRFSPALFGICKRYAKNKEEAEDLLQDIFVKIFLNISHFRFESSLLYWMKKIAINTLISYHKKHNHLAEEMVPIEDIPEHLLPVTIPTDPEIPMDVLLAMINKLPMGYRMVFNLREIEGLEFQKIAEMLECSQVTVRSQLYKAKNALKKQIEDWRKTEIVSPRS